MQNLDRLGWAEGLCFRSYGLRIGIRVNQPEVLDRLMPLLPPGWEPAGSPAVDFLYSVRVATPGKASHVRRYHLLYGGPARLARSLDLEDVFRELEKDLQLLVAEAAPRRVFVHAGVVGWRGQAILLPGRSFSGKTTLVSALVRAGGIYYSDEYAVLDARGRVHPYSRPLRVRVDEPPGVRRVRPEELGGRSGSRPLPVGLILFTRYRPGARWRPRALGPGPAALGLLANTVPAIRKPQTVMATFGPPFDEKEGGS